ncbi:hypothetical protein ACFLQ6_01505 [Thermoproteota archaeon]
MNIDDVWKEMESEFRSNWIYAGNIKDVTRKFKAEITDKDDWRCDCEIKLVLFAKPGTDLRDDPDPILTARNIEIGGIRHKEKEFLEWKIKLL